MGFSVFLFFYVDYRDEKLYNIVIIVLTQL